MAVLVEGISVIIKRKIIEAKFPGGWEAFVEDVPNETLCADNELARVGFMSPCDVKAYIQHLEEFGFCYLSQGRAVDLVVGDQLQGPAVPCDWGLFGHVNIGGDPHQRVAAYRATGTTVNMLIFPDGWKYDRSLSQTFGFVPGDNPENGLTFLRWENNVDVYHNSLTDKEVYTGRTTDKNERGYIEQGRIMRTNREILNELFEKQAIDIRRGPIFDTPVVPVAEDFNFDRIEGMMLGLAIGDSLGITTEGMLPRTRRDIYGEIRDYIPNQYVDEAVGFPSDDTQLAFWTLEQMIADGGFKPGHVAARFCSNHIFGLGASVRKFIANYRSGLPWQKCGPPSAGNGALMRIAPMLIPHLKSATTELRVDTALSAMLTHNDSGSIAACLAFVEMLRQLLQMKAPPDPMWWVDSYVEIAAGIETGKKYKPRGGRFVGYEGPVWRFVAENVSRAREENLSVLDACDDWYSGAYLLETIPSVLYIMMCHGHYFEEALVRSVNDTKDNDTIAAIVGALAGALHGKEKIPDRWLRNLSGRTTESDDGKVFEILEEAKRIW